MRVTIEIRFEAQIEEIPHFTKGVRACPELDSGGIF
jgi:hypothetical protein